MNDEGQLTALRPWLPERLLLGADYTPCQDGCTHCAAGPDEPCYLETCPCWPYSQDDENEHRLADEVTAALRAHDAKGRGPSYWRGYADGRLAEKAGT